ncbi:hypothetical protein COT99_02305 [Candidatus Falkowbacteria bacterium CG10_big_fil_rev_8_21_14_0_10_43_10]|uniref:Class I SAM-dependent methyltransferase n=1 Tax=Candidatus Falkowbacteria bacterium CG10_big_fil_rev_8_21_14_0_10_43_10 TaxID=1974567 RepID=A0A2H0V3Y9_9BACT|nr:MAG: hypothetical protein COT99_02305 [Candidatus Falkowbacteria bacterium CG10_big_fil_rev_8_21_14_0_10_43_10]
MSTNNFEKQTGRDKFFDQIDGELKKITNPATGEVYSNLTAAIDCPLCGVRKDEPLFTKQGFRFVRCQDCGIIYVNPQMLPGKLVDEYREDSAANRSWKDILLSPAQVEFNNKNYGIILDVVERYQRKGRVLDIGCSFGHFLDLARRRGFTVEGMELENEAVKYARKELNLTIHQKVLVEAGFAGGEFDIAAALGVLEHVSDPLNFLKDINRILKPEGVLVLTLPNVVSLVCMVLKEKARCFTGRNHLTYFSLPTLDKMLNKAGFKIVYQESYVSGINSITNELQSLNPFADLEFKYLPAEFSGLLQDRNKKQQLEDLICRLGLGYKLRAVAKKIT